MHLEQKRKKQVICIITFSNNNYYDFNDNSHNLQNYLNINYVYILYIFDVNVN